MSLTEEQLKALAQQLGKPDGEHGINVANMMHDSNIGMTRSTYNALNLTKNDTILELGHGNGKHITEILSIADGITYSGLEISDLMKTEAESQALKNTSFTLYNGIIIPFEAEVFKKAMTVNTIYFWQEPVKLFNEVYRVLKTKGILTIGFAHKQFMETLPFTQHGFNLYDDDKLANLVAQTNFTLVSIIQYKEQVRSKADEMVERVYAVATLQK
ncbi:MAG: methyltransferase domain-containing protein [Pedobacter sp.]|nr:MAG: methyltransferase domain-containing protein [Pedobacter sp.]